jgi:hypothetical protein
MDGRLEGDHRIVMRRGSEVDETPVRVDDGELSFVLEEPIADARIDARAREADFAPGNDSTQRSFACPRGGRRRWLVRPAADPRSIVTPVARGTAGKEQPGERQPGNRAPGNL